MPKTAKEVMTDNPVKLSANTSLREAAQIMRDRNIGDVLVFQDKKFCGIVTDRDIVVRGLANGADPGKAQLAEICSRDLVTCSPEEPVDTVMQTMADKALRRIPVVEDGDPIGIVSLGDLAIQSGERSVLSEVSEAPANR